MAENAVSKQCVVIGGSAGGLPGMMYILGRLRPDFPAPIVIVLHRSNDRDSTLTTLLSHKTTLTVKEAEDKETIEPGTIYIAPADYHLLIEKDYSFSLDHSEKVQFSRPSIDVTIQTAAEAYGSGLIAILLSGANADGTAGLKDVRRHGGISIVQDPAEALVSFMPQSAIDEGVAAYMVTMANMVALLHRLVVSQVNHL
jgi:two-component system chemotaxis response regulator CheB